MDNVDNSEVKKIYSQRGNVLMLKQGFKYSKYGSLQTGEIGWKCVEKSCRAKLYTIGDDCRLTRETGKHSHIGLDANVIMRQAISNRLKRESNVCIAQKPSKLVELVLRTEEQESTSKLTANDIKLIKDNMYHARAKWKQIRSVGCEKEISPNNWPFRTADPACTELSAPIIAKNLNRKKMQKTSNSGSSCNTEECLQWFNIEPHFLASDLILD